MDKRITRVVPTAAFALFLGCSQSPVGPGVSQAPELPPAASMSIPGFANAPLGKKAEGGETYYAATMAYTAVVFWTTFVAKALETPVTLFALCHTARPTPLNDNSGWQWVIGDASFTAKLVARVESDSVRWQMYVTGNGLNDFKWFDGTAAPTGLSGYWRFYGSTATADFKFAYAFDPAGAGLVKAEVVNAVNPEFGNYLQWSGAGNARAFEAHDAVKPETIRISWDETIGNGAILNVTTSERICWDTKVMGYRDVACP